MLRLKPIYAAKYTALKLLFSIHEVIPRGGSANHVDRSSNPANEVSHACHCGKGCVRGQVAISGSDAIGPNLLIGSLVRFGEAHRRASRTLLGLHVLGAPPVGRGSIALDVEFVDLQQVSLDSVVGSPLVISGAGRSAD